MVYSSIVFLLYFLPIFLVIYYLIDKKYKNIFILISSIFFYSWGAPKFIFVILGTTFLDFHLVKWMSNMKNDLNRKLMLTLSVSINFGLLFYFKYSNFFIENVNAVLSIFGGQNIQWTKLVLPIGISFYTFETITYVVDVYRRVHKPLDKFWDYQLYIILFPKLIAGPIIRYHDLADQITDRSHNDTLDNKLTGFYRFILGLAKKVLIANHMGAQADAIFALDYANLDTYTAWIGILAYTFQIYFDFSGYSDMAIGIAKMIGFKFPENFDNPYTSRSITEFWRRWHITLGAWMRNYLYIPLGGNRVSKRRLYFNLWLVFLASGLWHGASWGFVIWGAYHGLFLILERSFLLKFLNKIGKLPSTLFTFLVVVIGWVFFRLEHFKEAIAYLKRMFAFDFKQDYYNIYNSPFSLDLEFYVYFTIAIFFAFFTYFKLGQKIQNAVYFNDYTLKRHYTLTFTSIVLLIICISALSATGFNPFIYFRF
ncbi:MAG: MBOAT family protein [Bacteroidales bacterium]|nr:MBOAT family protein [Bacteroidales bacterium]MDY0314359.1 MBOAT family O-acyltransferase [Bacteroidales bacterium]